MTDFRVITSDFINCHISTSKDDILFSEKRFPKGLTISELKVKLELITGGSCHTMQIEAYTKNDKLVCKLDDDSALLGSYPLEDGIRLHVIDQFQFQTDPENVPKYELPQEQYDQKSDTVRAYLRRNKLGKYNEENQETKKMMEEAEKNMAEKIPVGSRCKVTVQNAPHRLGTVMYTGPIEALSGYWIGVKYDEPLGKNDGSVKGVKYFECLDKYGAFVKPHNVTCGNFPEEDYDLNEEF